MGHHKEGMGDTTAVILEAGDSSLVCGMHRSCRLSAKERQTGAAEHRIAFRWCFSGTASCFKPSAEDGQTG